jgi:NAD(P)-dependent dehydrogenase (short-subunit alcohol dehydrogenase family)
MSHNTNNKVALIAGVSSGSGREIAQLLVERGLRVFGTVHDHPIVIPGMEVTRLDVTSTSSVEQTAQRVLDQANVPGDGVTLSRLRRFVPARMFDRNFRKQFRLDAAGSRP